METYVLPAPVSGLNAKDSVDLMQPTDALVFDNIFANQGYVSLRNGFSVWCDTGSGAPVESLHQFYDEDGDRRLVAAADGELWNVSTDTPASLGSGYTNDRWQAVMFKNILILVNGDDTPKQYNGATVSDATYTGIGDPTLLVDVTAYKSRLYFVQSASASIWYGGVGAIAGGLTELDVSDNLQRGGMLLWVRSWSRDTGSGLEDFLTVCSDNGEVLIFSGSYPGDASWALVGRFWVPRALGRRSVGYIGGDLAIATEEGLIPVRALFAGPNDTGNYAFITDRINNLFRATAKAYGTNFGWQVLLYPKGNYGLVNVPLSESVFEQYVINTSTGAWSRFTDQPAKCWALFDQDLYFGGTDGIIYQADAGSSDNGAAIIAKLKQAFNYFGDRAALKRVALVKPIFLGDSAVNFTIAFDADFATSSFGSEVTRVGIPGSAWDVSPWDVSSWDSSNAYGNDWQHVTGLGRALALRLSGSFLNINFDLSSTQIIYERGGPL